MSITDIICKKTIITMMVLMSMGSSSAQIVFPNGWGVIVIPYEIPKNKKLYTSWSNDGKTLAWGDRISTSIIPWKGHTLSWNDFQGSPKGSVTGRNDSNHDMHLSLLTRPYIQKEKVGNVTYSYYQNESLISTEDSWVVDSCKTEENMLLAQLEFNLWELNSRKAITDYQASPYAYIDEVTNYYVDHTVTQWKDIKDSISSAGNNIQKLKEKNEEVENELKTFTITPEKLLIGLKEKDGMYFNAGLTAHVPFSKYVSSGFGFNLGGGGIINRHMIGIDLDFAFGGKCKRDIHTDKGTMMEGDKILSGAATLQYGYNAIRKSSFEMTPLIGFGLCGYENTAKNSYGNKSTGKTGISFGIGCNLYFILSRQITFKTEYESIRNTSSGIGVKPYLNFTHYNGDLGWVPSLNIAINWNLTIIKLK